MFSTNDAGQKLRSSARRGCEGVTKQLRDRDAGPWFSREAPPRFQAVADEALTGLDVKVVNCDIAVQHVPSDRAHRHVSKLERKCHLCHVVVVNLGWLGHRSG